MPGQSTLLYGDHPAIEILSFLKFTHLTNIERLNRTEIAHNARPHLALDRLGVGVLGAGHRAQDRDRPDRRAAHEVEHGRALDLERLAVAPSLDCGFPLCRFSDADLGWLVRLVVMRWGWGIVRWLIGRVLLRR